MVIVLTEKMGFCPYFKKYIVSKQEIVLDILKNKDKSLFSPCIDIANPNPNP